MIEKKDIEIQCSFNRANPPFWHGNGTISGAKFLDRGGRSPSIVAVYNPAKRDFRMKVWLDDPLAAGQWYINGVICTMSHKGGGFYQCNLSAASMNTIIRGNPAVDDFGDDPLDMCVETRFAPDPRADYLDWQGNGDDFPEWMGKVNWVKVTPPRTGGGSHQVSFEAPDIKPSKKLPQMMRINGVWGFLTPVADTQDSRGYSVFGGRWWVDVDPAEMEAIRSYGQDEEDIELENEPTPPRWRQAIRDLHTASSEGIDREVYYKWQEDVKVLRGSINALSVWQGQLDFHMHRRDRIDARRQMLAKFIKGRYNKRPKAYKGYTESDWLREGADRKAVGFFKQLNGLEEPLDDARKDIERFESGIQKIREKYDAALARCEEREAEYADEIADVFGPEAP